MKRGEHPPLRGFMKRGEHFPMWKRFIRPKPVGCAALLLRGLAWMFFLMGLLALVGGLAFGLASGSLFWFVGGSWLVALTCYYGNWSDFLSVL